MQLKNTLLVVKDVEKAKRFYCDVFGFSVLQDNDGNLLLTDGLALQDEAIWRGFLGRDITPKNHACELYFEEADLDAFLEKLERLYPDVEYVHRKMTHRWGQTVTRFYDLDGNLIEVGTPM